MIYLQALAIGQEAAYMTGVAMSQAAGPQAAAVVVPGTGTVHHLIVAVAIKVCDMEGMVALSVIVAIGTPVLIDIAAALIAGINMPQPRQLIRTIILPGFHHRTAIDATSQEYLPALAGKLRNADAKRVGTLPVVIAP